MLNLLYNRLTVRAGCRGDLYIYYLHLHTKCRRLLAHTQRLGEGWESKYFLVPCALAGGKSLSNVALFYIFFYEEGP